jgi:hypothetical protein
MNMRLLEGLISVELVQLEKQGRKTSKKNGKEVFNPWRAFVY